MFESHNVWRYFTHLVNRVDYRHALPIFHITSTYGDAMKLILITLVAVVVGMMVACEGGSSSGLFGSGEQIVTLDNYMQIRNDMSYSHVVRIIGTHGVENSRNRIEGIPGVMDPIVSIMYTWTNGNGSGMNAIFQNDKLFQKSQFALK